MTVQLTDEQVTQLQAARSSLSTVISRNRTRWVDIELAGIRAALDAVLPRTGGSVPGAHGSPTDDRMGPGAS